MPRGFFAALTRNKMSLIGTALVAASATLIVTIFLIQQIGFSGGAYLGIITFLLLPMLLAAGLVLIPVGISRERKRAAAAGEEAHARFPVLDLNDRATRKGLVLLSVLTVVAIVILASATYKGVEVMDSVAFCGTVCHTVMQPEYTAYQRSPHAHVPCVDCHIGPGADWFVKSKISGAWQLFATALDIYPKPIPVPIHNLRPARETCEQCHWPTAFVGELLETKTNFAADEANTPRKSALLLKVGGIGAEGLSGREPSGIHWHVNPGVQIRYRSDESRETIYDIELTKPDGTIELFKSGAADENSSWRVMDCVDCHNRPSHGFDLPGDAVDRSMANGGIDASLPFVKRESMRLLQVDYKSQEEARIAIPAALKTFYETQYPELAVSRADAIDKVAGELVVIYSTNVFPQMNVTWGTYPKHIGHQENPGCFRCHDARHKTDDGKTPPYRCDTCHVLLPNQAVNSEILNALTP